MRNIEEIWYLCRILILFITRSVVCILLDDRIPQKLTSKKSPNLDDFSFFKKVLLLLFATHTIKTQDKRNGRIGRIYEEIGDRDYGDPIKRISDHGTPRVGSVS